MVVTAHTHHPLTLSSLPELRPEQSPECPLRRYEMSSKHTPGPWQVMNDYNGATIVLANVDGETFPDGTSTFSYDFVCDTFPDDVGQVEREIAKANARLIAAAPELLDALRNLVAVQPNLMANSAELADARAALAKAGGRS